MNTLLEMRALNALRLMQLMAANREREAYARYLEDLRTLAARANGTVFWRLS
jgi:hypothetical protein